MDGQLKYSVWRGLHEQRLAALQDRKVIVTYSGGKDSSVVLHLMSRASAEFGFTFEVHGGTFPHHVLNDDETSKLKQYWGQRGVEVNWHDIPENDDRLEQALTQGTSPCLICNRAKKAALLKYFSDNGNSDQPIVFVISYSLWDLVSASVEHLLGARYRDTEVALKIEAKPVEKRFQETAQRFYPWLDVGEKVSIFKPLIRYNDKDINEYIQRHEIPLTSTPCSYKGYRPKRLFAQYYEAVGLSFDFDSVYSFAKECMDLPDADVFEQQEAANYFEELF